MLRDGRASRLNAGQRWPRGDGARRPRGRTNAGRPLAAHGRTEARRPPEWATHGLSPRRAGAGRDGQRAWGDRPALWRGPMRRGEWGARPRGDMGAPDRAPRDVGMSLRRAASMFAASVGLRVLVFARHGGVYIPPRFPRLPRWLVPLSLIPFPRPPDVSPAHDDHSPQHVEQPWRTPPRPLSTSSSCTCSG